MLTARSFTSDLALATEFEAGLAPGLAQALGFSTYTLATCVNTQVAGIDLFLGEKLAVGVDLKVNLSRYGTASDPELRIEPSILSKGAADYQAHAFIQDSTATFFVISVPFLRHWLKETLHPVSHYDEAGRLRRPSSPLVNLEPLRHVSYDGSPFWAIPFSVLKKRLEPGAAFVATVGRSTRK